MKKEEPSVAKTTAVDPTAMAPAAAARPMSTRQGGESFIHFQFQRNFYAIFILRSIF